MDLPQFQFKKARYQGESAWQPSYTWPEHPELEFNLQPVYKRSMTCTSLAGNAVGVTVWYSPDAVNPDSGELLEFTSRKAAAQGAFTVMLGKLYEQVRQDHERENALRGSYSMPERNADLAHTIVGVLAVEGDVSFPRHRVAAFVENFICYRRFTWQIGGRYLEKLCWEPNGVWVAPYESSPMSQVEAYFNLKTNLMLKKVLRHKAKYP